MIGVLILTHGKFADGVMDSVSLIMGKQENVQTLSLCHGDDIQDFAQRIRNNVIKLDEGEGVVVFTDLFSASPYNQAAMSYPHIKEHEYKIISGFNLPMLIEAFNQRMIGSSLDVLTAQCMETGIQGIKEFFNELEKQKK